MTRREKYLQEHPNAEVYGNGNPMGICPDDIVAFECSTYSNCKECWNQEVPETNSNETRKETTEMEDKITAEKVLVSANDQIKYNKEQIKELEKDIKLLEERKRFDESARQTKMMYDSYVDAGFTETQAWEIVMTMINKLPC